jgi:hypothetical protein
MNKEQEYKFEKWWGPAITGEVQAREAWEACLTANGINTEEPVNDETTAAPEWVIEMMRTGKAVRCRAWEDGGLIFFRVIVGFCFDVEYSFYDDHGSTWKHAEPIPAWHPKDGEAVFYQCDSIAHIGKMVTKESDGNYSIRIVNGDIAIRDPMAVKPFDASKIGQPWSEI